jgi:hypothetical protein
MKIIDNFVLSMLHHNLSIQQRWNKKIFHIYSICILSFCKNDIDSPLKQPWAHNY